MEEIGKKAEKLDKSSKEYKDLMQQHDALDKEQRQMAEANTTYQEATKQQPSVEQEAEPFHIPELDPKWKDDPKAAQAEAEKEAAEPESNDAEQYPQFNKLIDHARDNFDPDAINKEAEARLKQAKDVVPADTMENVDKAIKSALEKLGSSESVPMIIGLLIGGGFVLHHMKK